MDEFMQRSTGRGPQRDGRSPMPAQEPSVRSPSSLFACLVLCGLAAPASALAQGTVLLLTSPPDAAMLAGPLALELGSRTTLEVVVSPAGDLDTEVQARALVAADPSATVVLVERQASPPRVHVIGASGERSTPLPAIEPEHAPRIAATIAASLVAELREGPLRVSAAGAPTVAATTPTVIELVDDALALDAPGAARTGGPTLFAQLGVGLVLRERAGAADPTFTQRIAFGLEVDGTFRAALMLALPMFYDEYEIPGEGGRYTGSSNAPSYVAGVELSHRAALGLLALHVGGSSSVASANRPAFSRVRSSPRRSKTRGVRG